MRLWVSCNSLSPVPPTKAICDDHYVSHFPSCASVADRAHCRRSGWNFFCQPLTYYNGRYAMPPPPPPKKKKGKADLTTVLHIRELPHLHMKLAVWFSCPTTNNKNPMICLVLLSLSSPVCLCHFAHIGNEIKICSQNKCHHHLSNVCENSFRMFHSNWVISDYHSFVWQFEFSRLNLTNCPNK